MLILAISLGGYSAAAHAFADEGCTPSISEHQADQSIVQHDCTDRTDNSENSEGICLDCHHCCASHALISASMTPDVPSQQLVEFLSAGNIFAGEYLLSLLRPPKTLV